MSVLQGDGGVELGELGVAGGELVGQLDHHPALLDRGVVLHLAVEHDGTGAVTHGGDHPTRMRHLGDIGHTRIAMLAGIHGLSTSIERTLGYCTAIRDAGREPDPALIVSGLSRAEPAIEATLALMRQPSPPTAIVAGNNLMALGAMRALRQLGLRVPEDVALVAFDDFAWADLFSPRLTTLAQPCRQIGEEAMELLLERIRAPNRPARGLRLPATLQHRDSCGCRHEKPSGAPDGC